MLDRDNQLDDVCRFYNPHAEGEPTLFEVWERGAARGDSVTPSTYCPEYREWMQRKLINELDRHHGGGLLSLGCGNAAVEGVLAGKGYRVLGVDAMQEAVELAQKKGVDACQADIMQWSPETSWPVIYMDGVLGHLYDPAAGMSGVLTTIRSWLAPTNGAATAAFVASNDAPNNGAAAQPAPNVDGFHWLSAEYMRDQAYEAGFDEVAVEKFRYIRPKSGERVRSVIIANVRA